MNLSDKQGRSIGEATASVNLWDGAVRSGKTISSLIAWAEFVANGPRGPLLMVGKTLDTLDRNVLEPLADLILSDHPSAFRHVRNSTRATLLGRTVHVMGADDRTAETRIRGLTLAGAYIDEASLLPLGYWPMLRTRLSVPGARLFATTNPDNPLHWLKTDVIDQAERLGYARWQFRLNDNPYLTDEFKQQLDAELTGLFRRRFLLGEWVAAEGAIYDMLDLGGRHTARDLPAFVEHWLGVDYGTTNPFHAVLLSLGDDQRLYVTGEWRWDSQSEHRQMTDPEYTAELREWLDQHGVWPRRTAVDPSAASFRAQCRTDGWVGLTAADNAVEDGIRAVASLLATGRLVFAPGAAPWLEKELQGYVWDDAKQAKGEDAPLKLDDHGPDALRYAVMACRSLWRRWLLT